jgi:UDP-glucuronate 4-epimerase
LNAAEKSGVRKFIYASSSSVYGDCSDYPFTEESDISRPLNPYARTKIHNESYARDFSQVHSMSLVGLRFFTVYGPWTRPDMATFTFIKNIFDGNPVSIFEQNGEPMSRDFTYVDDIVMAISKLLDSHMPDRNMIFNIGEGSPITISDFVRLIERKCDKNAHIEYRNVSHGEMIRTYSDCTKLFQQINFKPSVSVDTGIANTVAWYKQKILSL